MVVDRSRWMMRYLGGSVVVMMVMVVKETMVGEMMRCIG